MRKKFCALGFDCLRSHFRRVIQPQIHLRFVVLHLRLPLPGFLVQNHPAIAAGIRGVALKILAILLLGGWPQIRNPVVAAITIDVVKQLLGELAVDIQPRQTMSHEVLVVQGDPDVPMSVKRTCLGEWLGSCAGGVKPPKLTSQWAVMQD